jgi:hypothetical protein
MFFWMPLFRQLVCAVQIFGFTIQQIDNECTGHSKKIKSVEWLKQKKGFVGITRLSHV